MITYIYTTMYLTETTREEKEVQQSDGMSKFSRAVLGFSLKPVYDKTRHELS